jgi:hypothetical protein
VDKEEDDEPTLPAPHGAVSESADCGCPTGTFTSVRMHSRRYVVAVVPEWLLASLLLVLYVPAPPTLQRAGSTQGGFNPIRPRAM